MELWLVDLVNFKLFVIAVGSTCSTVFHSSVLFRGAFFPSWLYFPLGILSWLWRTALVTRFRSIWPWWRCRKMFPTAQTNLVGVGCQPMQLPESIPFRFKGTEPCLSFTFSSFAIHSCPPAWFKGNKISVWRKWIKRTFFLCLRMLELKASPVPLPCITLRPDKKEVLVHALHN